jgi:hypothetical protein
VAVLLTAALAAHGDEALRTDGTRLTGQLTLSETGRFLFRTGDRDEPVAGLDRVSFAVKPPTAPPVTLWHQIHLGHGEIVLAEIRRLDDTALHVRPVWADSVAVPRVAIERVTHLPGWRPVLFDSFDTDLGAWTKTGEPRAEGGRFLFDRAGQGAEAAVKPVATGRVVVAFHSAVTIARRIRLDLGFVRNDQPRPVHVEFIGPSDQYTVTADDKPDLTGKLRRDAGTHRLSVEFDKDRLAVFVDDFVLWVRDAGPGELRSIKLESEGDGIEAAAVDDVLVAAAVPVAEPRAWADLTADSVRSPDGAETFGTLSAAGPNGVTLDVRGKKTSLGWAQAAEFTFRRGPVSEKPTAGEHLRLRVRTAEGQHDILEGAVQAFDDKAVELMHPVLGRLTLPRDRVEEVRFLFHGRRLPVDSTPHHLGTRPAFGFAVPKPEGLRFTKSVSLDNPAAGFVVIDAAHVGEKGAPVEVLINGERVGELNRRAGRAEPVVRAYRLPIAAGVLRRGENEIEVRLRPPAGGKVNGIDVRAVRLELDDPR